MLKFGNKSVGFQLRTTIFICLLIAFGFIGYMVYQTASSALLDKTVKEHQERINVLSSTLAGEFDSLLSSTERLESAFRHGYLSDGLFQEETEVEFAGYKVKDITYFGDSLIGNYDLVDRFTQNTGAVATLFVPAQNDFLRVSTSLTNQNGQRAVGTLLGKNHPGYQKLKNGQSFYAQVELFGSEYLTYYHPIVLDDGTTIGISFIGLPVSTVTKTIFKKLESMKWGETGYTFIVDNAQKHLGQFLLHPTFNKSDLPLGETRDYDGNQPYKKVFEADSGVLFYPYEHNGVVGEKYAVYATVPGWNWKILGGTYVDEVTQECKELLTIIAIISALVGSATFLVVTLVLRKLMKPLGTLSDYMDRVGQGEVSLNIPADSADSRNEIARLTSGLSSMAEQLNGLVGQIRTTSDSVFEQAQSVAHDASMGRQQAEIQKENVVQVVTAVEEMATSAQSVAHQVESIAENVREADTSSRSGLQLVEDVSVDVASLNDLLNRSAEAIEQVAEQSDSIQDVTRMIDEIAEQTNLLALNAAIEAARAGEQGRGFAVVADEVRTLAHRTQQSVQQVVDIIEQLRTSTSGAVGLMKDSRENAGYVLKKASEAGSALESIAEQVSEISGQSDAIAATSEQQAQVSQEIAANMTEMSQMNEQSNLLAVQSAGSAETLQGQATELKTQVDFFS